MQVLALSPHTDDVELGCGGSLARLAREGACITCVAFSPGPRAGLREEAVRSSTILGVSKCSVLEFPTRSFLQKRQEILQVLYEYNQAHHVDIVLVPAQMDMHQDHQVITQEAIRAFKRSTILGYELPWNNIQFTTNYFVRLEEADVEKKLAALREYRSQADKDYFAESFMRGLLRVRGTQIQCENAEAFEAIRVVV